MHRSAKIRAASAMGVQYCKTVANLFDDGPQTIGQAKPMRLESIESLSESLESLARYIIRASFSQERIIYVPIHESSDRVSKVIYASKDGKTSKTFDALDWLAQLVTHIPNKGEQMVRYYGYCLR